MSIELNNVSRSYARGAIGADAVDLDIEPGELVALCGPSGSGKTTLLHLMGLLVRPDAGSVLLDGERVDGLSEKEAAGLRRRKLGFVFQNFGLLPLLSAAENVEVALRLIGGRRSAEAVEGALDVVGVADRAGHRPDELSGGEQQRVALARALVHDPKYLLADEPTGELDTDSGAAILGLLAARARHGAAVVVASHDPKVLAVADRALFVRDGQVHSPGRAELEHWIRSGQGPLSGRRPLRSRDRGPAPLE